MDNFGRRPQQNGSQSTSGMPASRPSVVKVPPQSQQHFIGRRNKPVARPGMAQQAPEPSVPTEALKQLDLEVKEARYPRRRNWAKRGIVSAIIAFIVLILGVAIWYGVQLLPANMKNKDRVAVEISMGSTPDVIAKKLKQSGVIRNELVFLATTRIQGVQNKLQAGTYRLSPSESMFSIVDHLVKGVTDTFDVTFLPGATVKENKTALMKAGYDKQEVDEAFAAHYDSPLFDGKPKDADLEGYIYGDTYKFGMGLPAKKVLEKVFAEFYSIISERRLDKGYEKKGLTLYQGITLASIIQREAVGGDEPQIAQVFYKRLAEKMPLGSDVTYQYIADKMGVPRDINIDSPYNTRRYAGLPPGPISSPGLAALRAVSLPAEGEYLYFLSGDDDVTYFAKTLQEHEANIKNHCQKKCQII
ncbi:endolytic transglycosylase MltG [Candidatus Saccharibacteria bacterium TM7i]|nr:endolytic transglycosylase MltG [Candidatus Saccharibacteria bacterium TM7i]